MIGENKGIQKRDGELQGECKSAERGNREDGKV